MHKIMKTRMRNLVTSDLNWKENLMDAGHTLWGHESGWSIELGLTTHLCLVSKLKRHDRASFSFFALLTEN